MIRVGFQGKHGTFSDVAVDGFFKGQDIEKVSFTDFYSIITAVENEDIDYGLIPVENTTTGMISRTYDFFFNHEIYAVGEYNVKISENLIVVPGTDIMDLKEVYSHPEALEQCQNFFAKYKHIKPVAYQDTAASVEYIKNCNDHTKGALASLLSAKYYNLEVLLEDVQANKLNTTRFLCIRHKAAEVKDADKISTMFILKHEAGSLYNVLKIFAQKNINLLKLESRPLPNKNFEYLFYLDFSGNINDQNVSEVFNLVKDHCISYKILGCYKAFH